MNPQVPDELISAYFDGEVTPEERAAVERLLAESEDLQRELNETARLSALLHSFPRESAPVELVSNVLRQTDQMKLPSQPPVVTPSTRHVWREWKAAMISAFTTAACLLVLWNVFDRSNVHSGSSAVADNHLKSTSVGLHSRLPALQPDSTEPVVLMAEQAKELSVASTHDLQVPSKQVGRDAAGAPEVSAKDRMPETKSAAMVEGVPAAPKAQAQESLKFRTEEIDTPNQPESNQNPINPLGNGSNFGNFANLGMSNGDFVEQLRGDKLYTFVPQEVDTDNNVAVVYVDVADVERGGDTFQDLLAKRSIQPHSAVGIKPNLDKADAKGDGLRKRSEQGLDVYYVRAQGRQLAGTLEDAERHPELFRGWSFQQPVHLTNNNNELKELSRKKANYKKAEDANPAADKASKPTDAVVSSEAESEIEEANQAVQALIARNSGLNFNPTNVDLLQHYAANSNPKGGTDGQRGQRYVQGGGGNGAVEKAKTESSRAGGTPAAMADRGVGSYFVRLPANPAPYPAHQARAMLMNAPSEKPGNRSSTPFAGTPTPATAPPYGGNSPREAGARAVRMLLVLQPSQGDAGQVAPAGPEPAGKPGQ